MWYGIHDLNDIGLITICTIAALMGVYQGVMIAVEFIRDEREGK